MIQLPNRAGGGGGGGVELNDLTDVVVWANVPDANITQGSVTQHEAAIDHDALANFLSGEHFTEASIDHAAILNIGTNDHAAIDTHIGLSSVHFTEASITLTESQISDLQGYAILSAANNIFTSDDNYNEFHCEDAGTINERGIQIKNDLASNTDGYSIVAGTTGLFDGALIISDDPTDVVNNRSMQLVHNNAVIFGLGVKVATGKSFGDESAGALAYYAPRITAGVDRGVISMYGGDGFGNAEFWWESYCNGPSGLLLRRYARFITDDGDYSTTFNWHGQMKFMDIADNQTNMGTSNYLRIESDGTDANFVAVGDVADFNFSAADTYNFDNQLRVDQPSTSGAKTVLSLDQGDVDDTFIDFVGTSAADGTRSISSDTTEDSAKFGAIKIEINGVEKWIRIYDNES